MRRLAPLIIAFVSAPVAAQDVEPQFGGFAAAVVTGQFAQAEGSSTALRSPVVSSATAGPVTVVLEETALTDVAAALGGTVNEAGEAGEHALWICFSLADEQTLWFYSDGEMGDGKVTMAAVETGAPLPEWSCSLALQDIEIDLGLPDLGTPASEVMSGFGNLLPDGEGRFGFTSMSPHPQQAGYSVYQDIVFRVRDGVIDAAAVRQESGD